MSFVSYAQNFEDVMLWRALNDIENGFYIDIGAHDPTLGSVTKAFYDRGWSGINIEPTSAAFNLLNAARSRDINLQICAGAENGIVDLYDVSPSGLATVVPSVADKYKDKEGYSIKVEHTPVRTLESICKEYVSGEIHFLKIDVEGFEKNVLLGANFTTFRPWIVVLEATVPNSNVVNSNEWESIILYAGYKLAYFDGLNKFYISVEHKGFLDLFTTPPNYFDNFSLSSSCFLSRGVKAELKEAEAKTEQAVSKAAQAEAKTEQAQAKIDEIHAELHSVYMSRSWATTRPLRWCCFQLLLLKKHGVVERSRSLISKIVRFITHRSIVFLASYPKSRATCIRLIQRIGLYSFILKIHRGSVIHEASPVYSAPNKARIADLTPNGQRIYDQLKVAIKKQTEESR